MLPSSIFRTCYVRLLRFNAIPRENMTFVAIGKARFSV
jgi:hypothetical protein